MQSHYDAEFRREQGITEADWLQLLPRAAQGHALQRAGRVHVARDDDTVWVGGDVTPVVEGIVRV